MHAYSDVYLDDVVENQGKLFDYVANLSRIKIPRILYKAT